jgi:uncharacterized repeat protein (TIGR03803 family)
MTENRQKSCPFLSGKSGVFFLALIAAEGCVSAANATTETVLYNFSGGADGANPIAELTIDSNSNLYGATCSGGASGNGEVFALKLNAGTYSFSPCPP